MKTFILIILVLAIIGVIWHLIHDDDDTDYHDPDAFT